MAMSSRHLPNGGSEPLDHKHDESAKMEDASSVVSKMVKDFLATRDSEPSGRADVLFDRLSVEGNGKGVGA